MDHPITPPATVTPKMPMWALEATTSTSAVLQGRRSTTSCRIARISSMASTMLRRRCTFIQRPASLRIRRRTSPRRRRGRLTTVSSRTSTTPTGCTLIPQRTSTVPSVIQRIMASQTRSIPVDSSWPSGTRIQPERGERHQPEYTLSIGSIDWSTHNDFDGHCSDELAGHPGVRQRIPRRRRRERARGCVLP